MSIEFVQWDLDDDPDSNVQHCAEHGVTMAEVEEAIENAADFDVSRSSGRLVLFGDTRLGRHLLVVFEMLDLVTIYPITAYDVPRRTRQ